MKKMNESRDQKSQNAVGAKFSKVKPGVTDADGEAINRKTVKAELSSASFKHRYARTKLL